MGRTFEGILEVGRRSCDRSVASKDDKTCDTDTLACSSNYVSTEPGDNLQHQGDDFNNADAIRQQETGPSIESKD